MWPVLLLIIRENCSPEKMGIASVIMATASTGGKFAAVGVCALFAINKSKFMYCFLTAGVLSFTVAILFLFATGKIKASEIKKDGAVQHRAPKPKADKKSIILLILLGEFSLASYAITGGLQSWIPAILKDSYGLSDALSIFMSILVEDFYYAFRRQWFTENKPHGFEVHDIRFGGLIMRLKSCKDRLNDYISGKIGNIPELDDEIYYLKTKNGIKENLDIFNGWDATVSLNVL